MQFHIAVKCIQYNSQNISDIHVGHENKIFIFVVLSLSNSIMIE